MRSSKLQPLLILGAALLVTTILFLAQRRPEERPRQDMAPLVRIARAAETPFRFTVSANGAVSPRTQSDLIPQVSGEIIEISRSLAAGGFFEAGDLLARVDTADYRVDREAARAQVARAESEYGRTKKELERQRRLASQSIASESRIDDAENAYRIAEASLREAEARLERAARDLDRTAIRAPYRGRVLNESVDVGQFVNRGTPIAQIYAVDFAEVRLPLPDRELAYLDIPLGPKSKEIDENGAPTGARVELRADFAGRSHRWEGRLVRTEAELDPHSRMVRLVARVADPFGLETERSAPLAIGLFVEAEIEGLFLEKAFVLPRNALRPGNQIYIVDAEDRIRFREIDLLRTERDRIVVGGGLEAGERICTSPLDAAIDGMQVRVVSGEGAARLDAQAAAPESAQ
ncbi:MAG: efflux RND transporter periplasmic adaptor subunit [bacterium]|nr:efflux RND transporter periplasmic adaptor subunit [bacterium]